MAGVVGIASIDRLDVGNSTTTRVTATKAIITSKSVPDCLRALWAAAVSLVRRRIRGRRGCRLSCGKMGGFNRWEDSVSWLNEYKRRFQVRCKCRYNLQW
jgi:hypothetical protein